MVDKYINLIVSKCVKLKKGKKVFISYHPYNEDFVEKLVEALKEKGAKEIYLNCKDLDFEHDFLKEATLEEIEKSGYFDDSIYNTYALAGAAFIFFESPVPGIFNDIEDEKLALVNKIKAESKQIFRKLETSYKISWTIIPLYNKYWEDALKIDNLESNLNNILMLNGNPIVNWENYITKISKITKKLNDYHFEKLVYENKNGTNLTVGLPTDYKFSSISDDRVFVNLPSYEVFTTPHRLETEGIVHSTMPLYYNGGVVEDFSIEFKEGKVASIKAKRGKKILESIINMDETSSYLGEIALVECNNPIGKTGVVYKTTLLDENASCHLALGDGFGKGPKKTLLKKGYNVSKVHVDFMIGDSHLNVTGIKNGEKIPVMKNGRFVI